ncbi:hypothetical protein GP486_004576, partial [Trichoglossum hirsutum]
PPSECYAQKVVSYSKLDSHDAYFSGIHYSRLGKFLISPYKCYGDEWSAVLPESGFHFVTLCDLTERRDSPARTRHFSRPDELMQFLKHLDLKARSKTVTEGDDNLGQGGDCGSLAPNFQHTRPRPKHSGLMVFLRGFPSSQWLNYLGAALDIDPELFSRHLDVSFGFIPNASRLDCPYSTPFPKTRDLIQLRVCNTGSWNTSKSKLTLAALRESCEASMSLHLEDFIRSRNIAVGDSIVRRFMLHDLHSFSIEQRISIEVIYHTRTWSIVVWMDSGEDLSRCKSGPWLGQFAMREMTRFHPIFQHRSRMALSSVQNKPDLAFSDRQSTEQRYPQSIDHIHKNYGSYLKTEIMAHDAFYALNELFEFSAASVDQLLELFEGNIRTTSHNLDTTRISELLIVKSLVDDYQSYVKDILEIVHARGSPKWPCTNEPKQREKADRAANQLESRYRRLLGRCERLLEHCASNITILMNSETQRQTEKAIEQTDRLSKLSVLAYFYIPLTFATSFYGMNFRELGNQLSIWTYFVMAIPLLAISLIAWFIDVRSICALCWNFLKRTLHLTR